MKRAACASKPDEHRWYVTIRVESKVNYVDDENDREVNHDRQVKTSVFPNDADGAEHGGSIEHQEGIDRIHFEGFTFISGMIRDELLQVV